MILNACLCAARINTNGVDFMKLFLRTVLLFAFATAAIVTTACNTTRGVGEDIEAAGAGLKDSAERSGAN
jgi:predicted small secreted protein